MTDCIYFKKKKKIVWKIRVNSTRLNPRPDWPVLTHNPFDPQTQLTKPARFATFGVKYHSFCFFFFFFYSHFPQIGCQNFLFFSLPFFFPLSPWISATLLLQSFFSLSSQSLNFGNLVATISFFLSSTSPLGTSSISRIQAEGISVISLLKFNSFLTPLSHHFSLLSHPFLLEFQQRGCQNLLLSSISQITLNSTHITNKLNFLQYLAKKLRLRMVAVTQTHEPIIFRVVLVTQFFLPQLYHNSNIIDCEWQTMSKCLFLSGRLIIFS